MRSIDIEEIQGRGAHHGKAYVTTSMLFMVGRMKNG
jgi:hypothetical protein